jgi:hypothetical protein
VLKIDDVAVTWAQALEESVAKLVGEWHLIVGSYYQYAIWRDLY